MLAKFGVDTAENEPQKIQISIPPRQFDFISVSHRCISLQRGAPEKVVLHRDCSKRSPQDQQAIRYRATTENARKLASDPLKESDVLAAAAEKERSALFSSASLSKLRCDLSLCFFSSHSLLIKSSAPPRGRRASWPEPTTSHGSFLHHDPLRLPSRSGEEVRELSKFGLTLY